MGNNLILVVRHIAAKTTQQVGLHCKSGLSRKRCKTGTQSVL